MSNDSTRGGWHCAGRVVAPSAPKTFSRGEIAGLAEQEQYLNRLLGMGDAESDHYWTRQLAALDAVPPATAA